MFPELGIGLTLWSGRFENLDETWLRWVNAEGKLLLTADELAESEHQRAVLAEEKAESAEERAIRAEQLAQQNRLQAERLAKQLRDLGIDPAASGT